MLEQKYQTLLLGQLAERAQHAVGKNLPLYVFLCVASATRLFEKLFETVEPNFRLLSVARHRARAFVVEKGVDRYAAEPRVEGRLSTEAAERLERFEPDLLREVFRVFGASAVVQS